MSDNKISTLILKVDLHCRLCSKEIKKLLCKIQGRARIQSTIYDEEKNSVTISGRFYPDCLSQKLRCLAPIIIKDIQTPSPPPPPPSPPAKPSLPEPAEPEKTPVKQPEPELVQPTKIVVNFPEWLSPFPAYPAAPDHLWSAAGCCNCSTCGRFYNINDPSSPELPLPMLPTPAYGGPVPFSAGGGSSLCQAGYKVVYEEEPPCTIM